MARPERGIGDITSQARGSGARFNDGKPDLALIPLMMLANSTANKKQPKLATGALYSIGAFQATQSSSELWQALAMLGHDGWEECARVFSYGREKYAAWNWAKGMAWSVPLACAARHLLAMIKGEEIDPESGLPHRGHVFCNVVMLLQYQDTYPEGNDLPPPGLLA